MIHPVYSFIHHKKLLTDSFNIFANSCDTFALQFVNSLLDMLLRWHVMPMERFLLFLILRPFFSENEGKVAIYLATQLLSDSSCSTNQSFQSLRMAKGILINEVSKDRFLTNTNDIYV